MKAGLLLAFLLSGADDPVKLRLVVQLDTGAKDGIGTRKLTPEEGGAFAKSLETLEAIKSATWKNPVMTVELAPGSSLKFTDIKRAGKSAALPNGGHLQVVFNSLKLQGTVTLSLSVEKNQDKVAAALKSAGKTREVAETSAGYRFTIRRGSSVPIIPLIKSVARKTGVEYRIFRILRNITWHAPGE